MAEERDAADGAGGAETTGGGARGDRGIPGGPDSGGYRELVGDGRYRILRRLGRGGMAEVFAAEDVRLGRVVAVKLLRSDLAEDPIAKARFTREAQSVAGLNHHAVVAVFDSGEERMGGQVVPYMVMELVNGRTIREMLNDDADAMEEGRGPDGPARTNRALDIVSGVLEALAYSHQHGIVHRDIKPANVIINETGSVKVMDFGIARALHGVQSTMTQTGMVMGTPQYLSPEQALGKAVDTRSDLYAVGCLLYELLTLRPPFTGETPLSVVYQHVQDTPRPPSSVSPEVPPELDGLALRALAKNPEDRFQSAEEMRALVQHAQRMLREHGGHTGGLWNTGSLTADTPAMGTAAMGATAATTAMPSATSSHRVAETGRLGPPLLLGTPPRGEARVGGAGDGGPGGRRLPRWALPAVLAVAAVGLGVLVALQLTGGEELPTAPDPTPTAPQETGEPEETDEPEEPEETEEPEEETTGPFSPDPGWNQSSGGSSGGGQGSNGWQNGGGTGGEVGGDEGAVTEGTAEGADGGETGGDDAGGTEPTGNPDAGGAGGGDQGAAGGGDQGGTPGNPGAAGGAGDQGGGGADAGAAAGGDGGAPPGGEGG
ncbi:protein kinase [Streptomyces alkaliphilus]|uniref:non-specific serine/threonine protein kinase n=1 Tax=Streptomyces alkaliphilus TaxID=1472722 RepID=A0A7W3Y324_9ACTN|nr:protein kinase [Streptomyces alkaliphilus]MBB0246384.1 protein kinase [Streptomyces alkaliphilus]